MKKKSSYDYYLIIATAVVLTIISAICVYGMFYFKLAQIHQMAPDMKMAYMNRMNQVISPFIICLILLLSICVPKRLLPTRWLNRFAAVMIVLSVIISLAAGIKNALLVLLTASLVLQLAVLAMAVAGSEQLNFEKKGYWVRVGSSLIHLGLILFILDLFLHEKKTLHLVLFWVTTAATTVGMIFCFYSETVVGLLKNRTASPKQAGKDIQYR